MKPLYCWIAVVVAFVLLWPQPGLAQRNLAVASAQATEQRVALVIGNGAYKEGPLRNPANDATDIAATLRSLGFAVTLRTNADTRQMRTAIREFAQNLKRGGVGLFYFAGHGIQSRSGKNYLIPVGADLREEYELEDDAVDANRVLAGMEDAGNRVNIVILDACRNNPFARSWRSASYGLAQMHAPTGSFVGFATAPGSIAADGTGRNGIYTKYLLENLNQGDSDIDKVFTRVTASVAKETGNKQVPWKSSSLTGNFYFSAPAAGGTQSATAAPMQGAAAPTFDLSANDRAFWDSVKDAKNADEFRAYIDEFPTGQFAKLARSRLDAILSSRPAAGAPAVEEAGQTGAGPSISTAVPPPPTLPASPVRPPVQIVASADSTQKIAPAPVPTQQLAASVPSSGTLESNGDRYEGDIFREDGLGKGTMISASGNRYEGGFSKGLPSGSGEFKYASGDRYTGEVLAGSPHGKGVYQLAKGERYEGDFVNGIYSGKGVLKLPDNSEYEGQFVDGMPNGSGSFKYASGDKYEGQMSRGLPNGKGVYQLAAGDRYEGEFIDGKYNGRGLFKFHDGSWYEGQFHNGQFNGSGVYSSAAGRYEGEFVKGQFHGKGALKLHNGEERIGIFAVGKFVSK